MHEKQRNTGSSLVDPCYGRRHTLYTGIGRGSVLEICQTDRENTAADVATGRNIDASSSAHQANVINILLTIIRPATDTLIMQ